MLGPVTDARSDDGEVSFKSFANAIPQLAWIADESGSIYWYNDRWYEYTGTTLEEMRGWGWQNVHHPDHVDRVVKKFSHFVATGDPWEDTFPLRSRTGEWRWFLTRATPIRDATAKIVRFFGTNTDITEQRQVLEERERLLREVEFERSRFETIMRQMPAAVVVAEAPSGRLVFANEQINDVWGHPLIEADDVAGYREYIGFHPDGRRYEGQDWPLARSLATGEIVQAEDVEILRGDGRRAIVRLSSAPVRDKSGAIVAAVVLSQDITELKNAVRVRDEFLSIASHELKTPLTALKLQTEILRRASSVGGAPVSSQFTRALDKARGQTDRLAVLVDDLLDVAQIQTGMFGYAMREADLTEAVSAAMERVDEQLRAAGCVIGTDFPERRVATWVDPNRIEQVVINLLTNVAKYAPGAPVRVSITSTDTEACVAIEDHGTGIPEEMRERVFERFARATSYRNVSGLGLGLHISREIVQAHDGRIWNEPSSDGGTVFKFCVPRKPLQRSTRRRHAVAE